MSRSEDAADNGSPTLDTSRLPRGERAARLLVDAVAAGDDRLERHYLEIKGELDLKSSKDKAKLVKFILGAANRMPDRAITAFEGYAVMVIGVVGHDVIGLPFIEHLDIESAVEPFIGADGPVWDLTRVPVPGSSNQVLLLVVDPPEWGRDAYVCHKDGDGIGDGDIYVRTDGATRKAKSGDIKELQRRARTSSAPAVNFDVTIDGEATRVVVDEESTICAYTAAVERRLLRALPRTATTAAGAPATHGMQQWMDSVSKIQVDALAHFTEPEKRTEDQYRAQIAAWTARFGNAWPSALDRMAGLCLAPFRIRVVNLEKTYFPDVELKIHLEGAVFGLDHLDTKEVSQKWLRLPSPPEAWGPKRPNWLDAQPRYSFPQVGGLSATLPSPLDLRNSGSVDLTLQVGDIRPREPFEYESDHVLVVRDAGMATVHGTWEITARGHNDVYSGELTVPVAQPLDLTDQLRAALDLVDDPDDN